MVKAVFFLLYLLLITFFIMCILDTGFCKTIPLSIVTATFLMLMCASRKSLWSYRKLAIMFSLLLIAILMIFQRKNIIRKIKEFLCPGLAFYVILYCYLFYILKDACLSEIDDLYYWGPVVRDSISNNQLYDLKNMLIGYGYKPFLSLINITFCICVSETYSEGISIFATAIFCLSFLFAPLDSFKFKKEDIIPSVLVFISIVLASLCVQNNTYMNNIYIFTTTYSDWPIALIVMYGFYLIAVDEEKTSNTLILTFVLTALMLTKSISLALYLLLATTYIVKVLINKASAKLKLINIFILTLIPLIVYKAWSIIEARQKFANISGGTSSVINKSSLLNLIELLFEKSQILSNYANHLFTDPIIYHPFKISYVCLILIITVLLLVVSIYRKNNRYFCVAVFYFLGAIGYAIAIGYTYQFVIDEYESVRLVCFGRYLQMYTYSGLALAISLYLRESCHNIKRLIICTIIIILFVEPLSLTAITTSREDYFKEERSNIQYYFSNELKNKDVCIVSQNDHRNYIFYLFENNRNANLSWENINDRNGFEEILSKYQYIIVGVYDDVFLNYWKSKTDTDLFNSALYKIEGDSVQLVAKY